MPSWGRWKISILFVGQGGGADERKLRRPFIGRAGKRIRQQVIYARKLFKKHFGVAFSNTIRDNPEDNRVPTKEELEMCLPYLYQDIATLMGKGLGIVIPLGNAAKTALIESSSEGMSKDHGHIFSVSKPAFGAIAVMPTYHPSYVMRCVPTFKEEPMSSLDLLVINDIIHAYEYITKKIKIEVPGIQIVSNSLFD